MIKNFFSFNNIRPFALEIDFALCLTYDSLNFQKMRS